MRLTLAGMQIWKSARIRLMRCLAATDRAKVSLCCSQAFREQEQSCLAYLDGSLPKLEGTTCRETRPEHSHERCGRGRGA